MPWWRRVVHGAGALLLAGALLAVAPAAANADAEVCATLDALGGVESPTAIATALDVLEAQDVPDAAAELFECVKAAAADLTDEQVESAVCDLATTLNAKKQFAAAIDVIGAYRTSIGPKSEACPAELEAAQEGAGSHANPEDLGALWTSFNDAVLKPLTPIATFVGLSALVLIALGRLLALVPPFRDPPSRRWMRWAAWWVGIGLAIATPLLIALAGMSVVNGDGPPTGPALEGSLPKFLGGVLGIGWTWWWLVALAIAAVALIAYAFATLQRVSITLKPKDDGSGLDTMRLVATIDGMAGATTRGLEFPVGTDITTAASAVADVSSNKAVAAVQAAVKVIFGTRPWALAIENESADAVSFSLARNGVLIKAKRVRLAEGDALTDLTQPLAAERLAALVAGELIAAMRPRYRSEFDRGLHGATDGESIARQYVASSALNASAELRATAIPVLERAIELDPNNRAAWATLANFVYRNPAIHQAGGAGPHYAYMQLLDAAIVTELRRSAHAGARFAWGMRGSSAEDAAWHRLLPPEAGRVRTFRLRRNELLVRLVQTHAAAERNLLAAERFSSATQGTVAFDVVGAVDVERIRSIRALRRHLQSRWNVRKESDVSFRRRRQLFLIDSFRDTTWTPGTGVPPPSEVLWTRRRHETQAWASAEPGVTGKGSLGHLFACEDAVLRVWGEFDSDPTVAYSLACYRITRWLGAATENMEAT